MSDSTPSSGQWMDGRNGWWTASIAVIVLVIAALVAVLVLGGGEEPQAAAPASTPAPTSTPAPDATGQATVDATPTGPPATQDEGCGLPADDQEVPASAPSGTEWSVYNTVALPWSPTAGPTEREGATWSCYARTPAGALNAATVLSTTPYGVGAEQVLQEQVMAGAERDAQLESVRREPPLPADPGSTGVVAGFRFLDYSTDRATVQIAFAYGGEYFVWTTPVEWADGDWKLNLDPSGGAVPGQPIADLQGFNEWGAP